MSKILESGFEAIVLALLGELGYAHYFGESFDLDILLKKS